MPHDRHESANKEMAQRIQNKPSRRALIATLWHFSPRRRCFVGRSFSSDMTDDARSAYRCAPLFAEGLAAFRRAACIRSSDRSSKSRISNRNNRRLESCLTASRIIARTGSNRNKTRLFPTQNSQRVVPENSAALRFRRIAVRGVRRQLPDDEFLQDIGGGGCADADPGVFKDQRGAAIFRRIVEIGNSARGDAAEDVRVIRLPALVIALADKRIRDGVQDPRMRAPGSLVKIARILFQDRRKNGAADERAYGQVGIRRAVALSVTFRALSISAESVLRLLNSCDGPRQYKGHRVDGAPPG